MDAQRHRIAPGRAERLLRQILLVQSVAGLMQCTKETLVEKSRVVTGGDALVAGAKIGAERMGADIQATGGVIQSECRRGRLTQDALAVRRVLTMQDLHTGPPGRLGDGLHQGNQIVAQGGENAPDVGGLLARFIGVQEGVVGRFLVADVLRLPAHKIDQFLQVRGEQTELGLFARFRPVALSHDRRAGQFLHQLGGDFGLAIVAMPPLAQIHGLVAEGVGAEIACFCGGEQVAHPGIGELAVSAPRKISALLCSPGRALGRHVHFLVPADDGVDAIEQRQFTRDLQ